MKRVLLTGANGFIGRHTLKPLLERGFEVHAISRGARSGDINWHAVNLFDHASVRDLSREVEASHLLHLAWITEPGVYWQSPENQTWYAASANLLSGFKDAGGRRAVMVGTCAEYDWTDGHCVEEETPLRPESPYSAAKLACRQRAFELAHDSDLRLAWARVFFPLGTHERRERLVPSIAIPLLTGDRAECTDGEQVRDFMDVRDVADALAAVLDHDYHGDINIASGNAVTLKQIIQSIGEELRAVDRIDFGARERRANEPARITADTTILNEVIGWAPRHNLTDTINNTVAWWRDSA